MRFLPGNKIIQKYKNKTPLGLVNAVQYQSENLAAEVGEPNHKASHAPLWLPLSLEF